MNPRPPAMSGTLEVVDLGENIEYASALSRQEACADRRRKMTDHVFETLLLLEHAPVYTLGRNADATHILWREKELAERGVSVERTARGGDVTFHGPGQLVGYPILMLGRDPSRILPYITALEEVVIRAVAVFGVDAGRDSRNRGAWVGDNKLAALGVRVAGGVSLHGFALNVSTDLSFYGGMVPCGLRDAGVTSLAELLAEPPPMAAVKAAVIEAFAEVFGFERLARADGAALSRGK